MGTTAGGHFGAHLAAPNKPSRSLNHTARGVGTVTALAASKEAAERGPSPWAPGDMSTCTCAHPCASRHTVRSQRRDQEAEKDRPVAPHFMVSVARGPDVSKLCSLTELCGLRHCWIRLFLRTKRKAVVGKQGLY